MQRFRVVNNNCKNFFDTDNETNFQNYLQKYFKESSEHRIILLDNQQLTEYATNAYKRSIYITNKPSAPPACTFFSRPNYDNLVCSKALSKYNADELEAFKDAVNHARKGGFDIVIMSNEYPTHLNKVVDGKNVFIYGNITSSYCTDENHLFDEIEVIVNDKRIVVMHNVIRKKDDSYVIETVGSEII